MECRILFAIDPVIQMGLHLEELLELVIVEMDELEQMGISGEDDLDIQGNGLRPDGLGAEEPVELAKVLDPDLLVP